MIDDAIGSIRGAIGSVVDFVAALSNNLMRSTHSPVPIVSLVNVLPPGLAAGGSIGPGQSQPQNARLGDRASGSVAGSPDSAAGSGLGFFQRDATIT